MSNNLLIRMASHDNGIVHPPQRVDHYTLFISQAMLEEMRELSGHGVATGKMFLELLGAIDHAGQHRKPILIMGRKQAGQGSGFMLTVSIPVTKQIVNPFAGLDAGLRPPDDPAQP